MSESPLTGGCACGAIRYRIAGPAYDTGWCHCRLCQKSSGAPAMAFTTCALADFVVERGELATVKLVAYGERGFCAACGTSLTIHVDYQKTEIDIACATLDDPQAVTPEFHIFHDQKIGWVKLADGLPTYDGLGIDARGQVPENQMPGDRP